MGTEDRQYYLVYNGEIYNYIELRTELEALGHHFRSRSDTEVLLACYKQWGAQGLNRLVGMFAFAILDRRRRKLFLARDFFGIKPLYYTTWKHGFAFASEIAALLELPGVSRRVNPQRLYEYLSSGRTDHGDETLFADIHQLPPAHYMELSLDDLSRTLVKYWQVNLEEKAEVSFEDAAKHLRDLFMENIRLHLRSDVPIGAALSGGIDSSSIVMAMRHLSHNLDIHTFSYIADEERISEERWVDLLVPSARAMTHKVRLESDQMIEDIGTLVSSQGESFGSTSVYAQRRIFQRAQESGIKVMLDGQGADEILGGYQYFFTARLRSLIRQRKWTEAVKFSLHASSLSGSGRLQFGRRLSGILLPRKIKVLLRGINKSHDPSCIDLPWFRNRGVLPRDAETTKGDESLKEDMFYSFSQSSLPMLLRYEDRNSMAFSIESRVPFLTPALVQFAFSLPEEYLIAKDGTTKAVFRKAMRGIVPDTILDRKDKIGFRTTEGKWLESSRHWVDQVLSHLVADKVPALKAEIVRQEWQRMVQSGSFGPHLWLWINTALWTQKFSVQFE
jgi:asparagine synthase (glutamine-hydrolysing)